MSDGVRALAPTHYWFPIRQQERGDLMLLSVSHMISASGWCNQPHVLFPDVSARKASPTAKYGGHAHRDSAGDECDHRSHLAWMGL